MKATSLKTFLLGKAQEIEDKEWGEKESLIRIPANTTLYFWYAKDFGGDMPFTHFVDIPLTMNNILPVWCETQVVKEHKERIAQAQARGFKVWQQCVNNRTPREYRLVAFKEGV